jgi:hypothetical protein
VVGGGRGMGYLVDPSSGLREHFLSFSLNMGIK